jgi:hypothetical protein
MVRRQRVPRRKRVFVGCEGESEQGYAALLQRFAEERGASVHADAKVVSSAGDPLALVSRAIDLAAQGERGSKPAYSIRFLLLDTDLLGQNAQRDAKIPGLVARHGLVLVRQRCCFEASLLRHIYGHENDDPPNAAIALTRLQDAWPDYKKGLPAQQLQRRISLADVQRAAQNARNADFLALINALGLSPD